VGRSTCPAQQQQRVATTAACFGSRRDSCHQTVGPATINSASTWLHLHMPNSSQNTSAYTLQAAGSSRVHIWALCGACAACWHPAADCARGLAAAEDRDQCFRGSLAGVVKCFCMTRSVKCQ
jgi:hypothetical protein